MTGLPPSKEAKLRAIRERFAADLPALLEQLDRACRAAETGAPADVQVAHRHAHTLAGTAATFGLAAVSAGARALEAVLRSAREAGTAPDPLESRRTLVVLREAARRETSP